MTIEPPGSSADAAAGLEKQSGLSDRIQWQTAQCS
jgi:hypothetical protein